MNSWFKNNRKKNEIELFLKKRLFILVGETIKRKLLLTEQHNWSKASSHHTSRNIDHCVLNHIIPFLWDSELRGNRLISSFRGHFYYGIIELSFDYLMCDGKAGRKKNPNHYFLILFLSYDFRKKYGIAATHN